MSSPARMPKLMPSDRPCTRPAMQIWLTILVSWPEPGAAHQRDCARVGGQHRLGRGEWSGVAADHDRELAVLRAGLAARNRRVEKADAARLCRGVDLARDARRRRRVVDEDRAGLHRREARHRVRARPRARRRRCRRTASRSRRRAAAAGRGVGADLPPYFFDPLRGLARRCGCRR